ncbi:helix-turn-helix domain-containing protein [Duffyella gerundensis]|uniref:helix-turn-helix domain-containing protein n=1 Tax=Duffyella gerundensis TaxID=1619313 RepID=UPI001654147E|nr:XRE family transcriptional regulator [Duffyella gerundensis]
MHKLAQYMAAQLRMLRQQRRWSLAEAAERTGVSKAMLGQIERTESSPTVATLWKIATGFNVPFTTFIEPDSLATEPAQPVVHDVNQPISVTQLFPYDSEFNMDMLLIQMAPGSRSDSDPHRPGVVEHIWVVSGVLALKIETRWLRLTQGDTLRFAADVPHSYANAGNTMVQFHDVVLYPDAKS